MFTSSGRREAGESKFSASTANRGSGLRCARGTEGSLRNGRKPREREGQKQILGCAEDDRKKGNGIRPSRNFAYGSG